MSNYSGSAGLKTDSTQYAPSLGEGVVQAFSRARNGDLESAMEAISEAEKLIEAQRRRIAYLETLALNDEITGLMNRRGFMSELQRELASAKREPQAHGILMMFDLDGFKAVNDMHGHAAGDAYLSAFAAALTSEVRGCDVVARLGGDEFAVLMTRLSSKPGMVRAQTLLKSINGKSMNWRNTVIPLCTSAGIATYGSRDIAEAVLVSADLKLYADKQKRRKALGG